MADFGSALWNKPASGGGASDPVTRSLRFDGSSDIERATGSTDTTWTVSMWVKRGELGTNQYIFSWGGDGVRFDTSDRISVWNGSAYRYTTAVFRDVSSWYNIVLSCNSGTLTVIVNGTTHALSSSTTYPAWGTVYFGAWSANSTFFKGYLADIYGIESSALDHTSFTESNDYGGLKPKAYTGSFGTNGFHLDAQPSNSADLLVSSVGRNDGDTDFVDVAAGHTITDTGDPEHSDTVGNPFDSSGTAISFDGTAGNCLKVATSSDFDFGSGSYTYEGWFYFNAFNSFDGGGGTIPSNGLFSRNNSSTARWAVHTNDSGEIQFFADNVYNTGSSSFTFSTGQWYHVALCKNGTTYKVYVDGSEKISYTTSNSLDASLPVAIGKFYENYDAGYYLDGYCYDFRAQKGVDTGGSKPSATFELNPVYLGGDQSGNKNHFTPTSISQAHDVLLDTPTKNYATLNPLAQSTYTLTNGNLKCKRDASSAQSYVTSTIGVNSSSATTSKWYWEVYAKTLSSDYPRVGISSYYSRGGDEPTTNYLCGDTDGTGRAWASKNGSGNITGESYAGMKFDGSNSGSAFVDYDQGDILQFALDLDNNKLWCGLNGTWYTDDASTTTTASAISGNTATPAFSDLSGHTWGPAIFCNANADVFILNAGQDPTFAGNKTSGQDASQSEFYYAPPAGFKSLNTSNLDDPAVTPSENFNSLVYQGASPSDKAVTGVGFQPDLVWIKARTQTYNHAVYDSVRGATKELHSNTDATEDTDSNGLKTFDSDGFTVGSDGEVGDPTGTRISWNWKAHQSPSIGARTAYTVKVEDNSGDGWDANSSFIDGSNFPTLYMELWENRASGLVSLGKVAVRSIDDDGNSTSDQSEQTYILKCIDLDAITVKWHYDTSGDNDENDYPNSYNDYLNDQKITILDGSTSEWTINNHSNDDGATDYNYSPPTGWANGDSLKTATTSYTGSDTATLTSGSGPVEKYNAAAGFSIISYTGDGSSDGDTQDLTHSLGAEPEFIITKARTSADYSSDGGWNVYHKDTVLGTTYGNSGHPLLWLDQPYESYDPEYSPALPKSGSENTIITVNLNGNYGHSGNDSGANYVMYAWAGVEGYSRFGKVVGNGNSSDGVFCYLGFRPALVIMKNTTNQSQYHWRMWDSSRGSHNVNDEVLYPSQDYTETTSDGHVDFLSNGFKLRSSAGNLNNDTYIFAAWAEQPFSAPSNAR